MVDGDVPLTTYYLLRVTCYLLLTVFVAAAGAGVHGGRTCDVVVQHGGRDDGRIVVPVASRMQCAVSRKRSERSASGHTACLAVSSEQ